jgi:hypothetical protein
MVDTVHCPKKISKLAQPVKHDQPAQIPPASDAARRHQVVPGNDAAAAVPQEIKRRFFSINRHRCAAQTGERIPSPGVFKT